MVSPAGSSLPPVEWKRWSTCTRKKLVFATRPAAERLAEKLTKRDRVAGVDAQPFSAYHCQFCGSYHIGHEQLVEPCGLCDVRHPCHCPRLKSWCSDCLPLGAER
jgi:hypothetical protein